MSPSTSSSTTVYSIDESSIHPMDLISLARQKFLALYKTNDIRLRQEVLQAELIKSVRRHCRVPARVLVKRRTSEDVTTSSENLNSDWEEPEKKRKKDNMQGPFSAQDFLSQTYENPIIDFSALSSNSSPTTTLTPKRSEESRKQKIAVRKSSKCPDVFQRLAMPKIRK